MKIDVYTVTGTKKGTADLPASVFDAPVNDGLMHQAVLRQQGNRRKAVAHTKTRGEIQGSTKKLFQQKGTGRARRGSVRAPLLRGGSKAFGPRKVMNFSKDMPKKMRRAAIRSCLSAQAKNGIILGLESYPAEIRTKTVADLLKKLPVEAGRSILFVLPEGHMELTYSARNIPGVKTVQAAYLSPEDVLKAKHMIVLVDALKKIEEMFGLKAASKKAISDKPAEPKKPTKPSTAKKTTKKKTTKKSTTSSK